MRSLTTIRISARTRDDLKRIGTKGETYEQIVRRLVRQARRFAIYDREARILATEDFTDLD